MQDVGIVRVERAAVADGAFDLLGAEGNRKGAPISLEQNTVMAALVCESHDGAPVVIEIVDQMDALLVNLDFRGGVEIACVSLQRQRVLQIQVHRHHVGALLRLTVCRVRHTGRHELTGRVCIAGCLDRVVGEEKSLSIHPVVVANHVGVERREIRSGAVIHNPRLTLRIHHLAAAEPAREVLGALLRCDSLCLGLVQHLARRLPVHLLLGRERPVLALVLNEAEALVELGKPLLVAAEVVRWRQRDVLAGAVGVVHQRLHGLRAGAGAAR